LRGLARLARVLERNSAELGLANYRLLSLIAQGDEQASRLAARLTLGRPAVSATVDALEARGLLTRSRMAQDRRATALTITPRGRDALAAAESAMAAELDALLALTSAPAAVLQALGSLSSALDQRWALAHGQLAERPGPPAS
jgi:DNA-binding MarR family transcriptional regulator